MIFVDKKNRETDIAEIYRNTVLAVPALLNKKSTNEASFGKQAFVDWADSLLAGRDEFLSDYFDWVGTNASMKIVLDRTLALNADLVPLCENLNVFAEMNSKLFWYKKDAQQAIKENNKEKIEKISEKINELAAYCNDIISIK